MSAPHCARGRTLSRAWTQGSMRSRRDERIDRGRRCGERSAPQFDSRARNRIARTHRGRKLPSRGRTFDVAMTWRSTRRPYDRRAVRRRAAARRPRGVGQPPDGEIVELATSGASARACTRLLDRLQPRMASPAVAMAISTSMAARSEPSAADGRLRLQGEARRRFRPPERRAGRRRAMAFCAARGCPGAQGAAEYLSS